MNEEVKTNKLGKQLMKEEKQVEKGVYKVYATNAGAPYFYSECRRVFPSQKEASEHVGKCEACRRYLTGEYYLV